MRKLCARWVPLLVEIEQKRIRATTPEKKFFHFNRNLKEFLRRFVTMDKTWIHHYTPESHGGSKQWSEPSESAPKRPKTQQLARKVMATVYYYSVLLSRLFVEIRKKRPHLKKKKILFHGDNAASYTLSIAQAKKHELVFELLPHPPYSPDLAPIDYYLFPNLKRWLCGRRFASNGRKVERSLDSLYRAKRRVQWE